jgi:hypothetical protein
VLTVQLRDLCSDLALDLIGDGTSVEGLCGCKKLCCCLVFQDGRILTYTNASRIVIPNR